MSAIRRSVRKMVGDFAIPTRPIRKKIKGLPAFTTVKGGAYFFLSGIKALHYLTSLSE